jgi:hypothetical protein
VKRFGFYEGPNLGISLRKLADMVLIIVPCATALPCDRRLASTRTSSLAAP